MSPLPRYPAELNHQSPNLKPHLGWLNTTATTMPKHLVEGTFNAFGDGGHCAILDDEGNVAHEIWLDAIPGLDVFASH